jgi:hypothetical protein
MVASDLDAASTAEGTSYCNEEVIRLERGDGQRITYLIGRDENFHQGPKRGGVKPPFVDEANDILEGPKLFFTHLQPHLQWREHV